MWSRKSTLNFAAAWRSTTSRLAITTTPTVACAANPAPGMLIEAAAQRCIDLGASVMVGDRWRDVEAGRRAGCKTVLIDAAYDEPQATADFHAPSLFDA